MKKLISIALCLIMAAALLAGCGSSNSSTPTSGDAAATASSVTPKIFKVSHSFLPDQPTHIVLTEAAENIKERTNGEIILEVYPNYEIACGPDAFEQIVRDSYFISVFAASGMADYVPDCYVYDTPFAYNDTAEYAAMAQTDFAKEIMAEAEAKDIKILALDWAYGARCFGTTDKPIYSAEDVKGLKIRIPSNQVLTTMLNALGASPIPMPWSDVYSGLETGVVDGLEASLGDYVDNQFWEVIKYVTLDNHVIGNEAVAMSAKVFNEELTPEQQQIFVEEFAAAGEKYREMYNASEEQAKKTLEEHGVTIIEPDMESFRALVVPAMEGSLPGVSEGVYERMAAALETIRK